MLGDLILPKWTSFTVWFRSLFSWIMLGDADRNPSWPLRLEFRSLFSWIMLGDPTGTPAGRLRLEFRSLFSWIMLGDNVEQEYLDCAVGVSILVLLDHAGRLGTFWPQ